MCTYNVLYKEMIWYDFFSVYTSPWLLIICNFKLFNKITLITVHYKFIIYSVLLVLISTQLDIYTQMTLTQEWHWHMNDINTWMTLTCEWHWHMNDIDTWMTFLTYTGIYPAHRFLHYMYMYPTKHHVLAITQQEHQSFQSESCKV